MCELTTLKLILDTSFKGQPNTPSQFPYVFAVCAGCWNALLFLYGPMTVY